MTYTENSPVACNVQPPVEEEPAFDMEQVQRDNARLNQAILFATERHAGQLRKGTTLHYILHPLETLQILTEMQADIDLQIAGVLHDTIEDTETTAEELTALFGDDVSMLVNHHSEDKSKSWAERKTTAIIAAKQADERIKMLILADKLSNLRAIARDTLLSVMLCGSVLMHRKKNRHGIITASSMLYPTCSSTPKPLLPIGN